MLISLLYQDEFLVRKIAAEALCLADESQQDAGLALAVKRGPGWVADTAIRSCRHVGEMGQQTKREISQFLYYSLPPLELLQKYGSLTFTFSLSNSLRGILWALRFDVASAIVAWSIWAYCVCIEIAIWD